MRVLICALLLTGCSASLPESKTTQNGLPYGVFKFTDGPATCYTYYSGGISCVTSQAQKESE